LVFKKARQKKEGKISMTRKGCATSAKKKNLHRLLMEFKKKDRPAMEKDGRYQPRGERRPRNAMKLLKKGGIATIHGRR